MNFQPVVAALGVLVRALTTNSALGWAVVATIALIGLYAILNLWSISRQARRERGLLEATVSEVVSYATKQSPIADSDVLASIAKLPTGPTRSLLVALHSIRQLPNPSIGPVLNVVSQKEAGKLARFRPVPNSLMMLGLLGTVIGLAGVIGTLGPQVQSALSIAEPTDLAGALGMTLVEMQTAFSCTIYGVLFSVITSYLLGVANKSQAVLLEELEDATVAQLAPSLLPKSHEYQLSELREVLQYSQQFLVDLRTSIRESAEGFHSVLLAAGETTRLSVEGLSDSTTTMASLLGKVATTVDATSRSLQTTGQDLRNESANLTAAHTELSKRLDTFEAVLRQSHESIAQERLSSSELLGQVASTLLANVTDTQEAFANSLLESSEQMRNSHASVLAVAQGGKDMGARLDTSLADLKESVEALSEPIITQLAEINNQQAALVGAVTRFQGVLAETANGELHERRWRKLFQMIGEVKSHEHARRPTLSVSSVPSIEGSDKGSNVDGNELPSKAIASGLESGRQ